LRFLAVVFPGGLPNGHIVFAIVLYLHTISPASMVLLVMLLGRTLVAFLFLVFSGYGGFWLA